MSQACEIECPQCDNVCAVVEYTNEALAECEECGSVWQRVKYRDGKIGWTLIGSLYPWRV